MRWHCPPDTEFEIRALPLGTRRCVPNWLAVWGRTRYLSITESPHNIDYLQVSGRQIFCSLECQSGVRTRDLRLSKQAALTTAPRPCPVPANRNTCSTSPENTRHWSNVVLMLGIKKTLVQCVVFTGLQKNELYGVLGHLCAQIG